MKWLRFELEQNCALPWYLGASHRDFNRDCWVCYPLGLNLLVGFVMNIHRRLQMPNSFIIERGYQAWQVRQTSNVMQRVKQLEQENEELRKPVIRFRG